MSCSVAQYSCSSRHMFRVGHRYSARLCMVLLAVGCSGRADIVASTSAGQGAVAGATSPGATTATFPTSSAQGGVGISAAVSGSAAPPVVNATAGMAAPVAGTLGGLSAGASGTAAQAGAGALDDADAGPSSMPTPDASVDAGTAGSGAAGGGSTTSEPVTCPANSMLRPGETNRTLRLGQQTRTYLLHVPKTYTGAEPVPLVIDWHGLLLSGSLQRDLSGYAELSEKEGFIVAYPDGIDAAWNVGPCCTTSRDVDDVAFARALVAEIETLACIAPKRVYSVGYSMGGGMSLLLACRAADLFAAVAPAAFDLLTPDEEPCEPSRPITVIAFRGKDDPIVPYAGGASTPPNGLPVTIHFLGAEATFDFWKTANGCTGSPTTDNGCQTYANCAGGVQTTLCTTEGMGGHIPGDPEVGWATLERYQLP